MYVARTKALISCAFVYAHAKSRFYHDQAQLFKHKKTCFCHMQNQSTQDRLSVIMCLCFSMPNLSSTAYI